MLDSCKFESCWKIAAITTRVLQMNEQIHPWKTAYHSGMTAKSDFRAIADLGMPIGVVANALTLPQLMLALPNFLNQGGHAFVDSGAFTAFQKGTKMDWDEVVWRYDALLLNTQRPDCLSIVAPDVVGDQVATIALWRKYASKVDKWISLGARVIVPFQVGFMTGGDLLELACEIFGNRKFACGIPSNAAAMSAQDASTIRHNDFHVLGRVVLTTELRAKVDAILRHNPDALLTADANWLRSRISKISKIRESLTPFSGDFETRRMRAVQTVLLREAYPQQNDATLPHNQAIRIPSMGNFQRSCS